MVAAKAVGADTVAALRCKLLQSDTSLSRKYRILFSLRNIPGAAAEEAIVAGRSDLELATPVQATPRQATKAFQGLVQVSRTLQLCSGMRWHTAWVKGRMQQQ